MKSWKIVALLLAPPLVFVLVLAAWTAIAFTAAAGVPTSGALEYMRIANVALGALGVTALLATPVCWAIALLALTKRKR